MKLTFLMICICCLLSCNEINLTDIENSIKTDGVETNEHRIFVSSLSYNGNLGGLTGADDKCNTLAQAAGLTRNYKALISNSTENMIDRLFISGAIYTFDNSSSKIKVAEDDELWVAGFFGISNSPLLQSVTYTENKNAITGYSWTGSDESGVLGGATCLEWSFAGISQDGAVGIIEETGPEWILEDEHGCNESKHLICISQ